MENSILLHYGIRGMKWGVRHYRSKDGALAAVGEKRYDRDKRENTTKKKEDRTDTSSPDSWRRAQENLEHPKRVVDASSNLVREAEKIEQSTASKSTPKRMDLSEMTDKEMRDKINRELLERQCDQLFAGMSESSISKGRQFFRTSLNATEVVSDMTAPALSIALAVKKLNGK